MSGRIDGWLRRGPSSRDGYLSDIRSDNLTGVTGVYGVSSNGDARVDAHSGGKGTGVIVDGDLLHELEPVFLLSLGRYALQGGKTGQGSQYFSNTKTLFWKTLTSCWFVPFAADETNKAGEGEAGLVAPGEDGGEDGEGRVCGDERC